MSGQEQSRERLLLVVVTDVSTTWVEVIIRVQKRKRKKILLRLVNVSHYWPQQFFSGLHSLRWSNFITSKATITFPYKRNEFIKKIALLPLDRHLAGFLKFVVFFQPGESKITDLHQVLPHNQDIPCSKVSVK